MLYCLKKFIKKIFICLFIFFLTINIYTVNAGIFLKDSFDVKKQKWMFLDKSGYNKVPKAPEEIVAQIVGYLLSFLGVLFIILMIYAGFLWMTARGDSEQVSKSKEILISSIIGIIIVLSSYIITTTILSKLGEATGTL